METIFFFLKHLAGLIWGINFFFFHTDSTHNRLQGVSEMQAWSEIRSRKINYHNSPLILDYGLNRTFWSQATLCKEPREISVKSTIV